MVEEFIADINQLSIPLKSKIKQSIFETNAFLIENKPSLIEYAAFFGSIQIFRYLQMNGVELEPSLWLYVIHSNNPEMIHFLEENNVKPNDKGEFDKPLEEAIKCHHNEIADYIENCLMNQDLFEDLKFKDKICGFAFYYDNYNFFLPEDYEQSYFFFYLCQNNYPQMVEFFLEMKKDEIKKAIILTIYL